MSFFEVLKSKASDAVQSTNEIIEIGKLNIEIKNVENKLDEAYENIGRAIYDNYKDIVDLDDDVKGKCEYVDACFIEINNLKEQILKLKNKKPCIKCGHELLMEDMYCSKCGEKQPEIVVEEEEPAEDKEGQAENMEESVKNAEASSIEVEEAEASEK